MTHAEEISNKRLSMKIDFAKENTLEVHSLLTSQMDCYNSRSEGQILHLNVLMMWLRLLPIVAVLLLLLKKVIFLCLLNKC